MATGLFTRAKALLGREAPEPAPVAPRKLPNRFHAVAIVPGERACAEAKDLLGKRFLSREAPALPLKNCGSARCECRYEHYEDRRKSKRRAHDLGVSIDGFDGDDHRQKSRRDRRKTQAK